VSRSVLFHGVIVLSGLAGLLGQRLAFLPPYVTAVRPATGIVLAACLMLGSHVWPGVFLGAFLVRIEAVKIRGRHHDQAR
jgi:hypothetical protein